MFIITGLAMNLTHLKIKGNKMVTMEVQEFEKMTESQLEDFFEALNDLKIVEITENKLVVGAVVSPDFYEKFNGEDDVK